MISANDISEVSFRRANISGYNTKDVDDFLDEVKATVESLQADNKALKAKLQEVIEQNKTLKGKMGALAAKLESYKNDEDEIKAALISAHRAGENSIREAQEKAAALQQQAQQRYNSLFLDVDSKIAGKEKELLELKTAVTDFRKELMGMYRKHLVNIEAIPDYADELSKAASAPAAVQAEPAPVQAPVAEVAPVSAVQPEKPHAAPVTQVAGEEAPVFDFTAEYDTEDLYSAKSFKKNKEEIKFGDKYDISNDSDHT